MVGSVNPAPAPAYAELCCVSNFSFLEGASHPEELVQRAAELGYQALALADECSVAGVVRAHEEARRTGLHFIVGSRLHLRHPDGQGDLSLLVLCCNRAGYGDLCELITLARRRRPKGQYHLQRSDFTLPVPDGLSAQWQGLDGCLIVWLPEFRPHTTHEEASLHEAACWLRQTFGQRLYGGVVRWHGAGESAWLPAWRQRLQHWDIPAVALGDVRCHVRSRKPLHDVLRAIRLRRPVAECGYELTASAEAYLRPRELLARWFEPHELAATVALAERCQFQLDTLRYEYPDEIVPAGHTPASYLRQEAEAGARRRYPQGMPPELRAKFDHELELIGELGYEPYFLTVYDLIRFARGRGILCQGRGSAANSVVCWCLEITAADPEQTAALIERFISRERNEPPDIDIDFEHHRREEVIQYIYRKYGRQRAALTAVVISYRMRSVLRDTGKALGLSTGVIEAMARSQQWWDGRRNLLERMAAAGLDPESRLAATWVDCVQALQGFPRHLSQHPGGFVISRGPLSRLVPIENAAMAERSVVQWDKDDLDALGLLKVDVLGLGMLTVLRRTLELVARQRGAPLALAEIPHDCPHTYAMISRADTVGTFQIESRAQMSMLPRLRPRCFYDLVVQVAIVRPGPIQGGMVHPYLRRRQGLEPAELPQPALAPALGRTLGVPIFQEQVMQVAMVAAGFSPGRADSLRRAMAAWRRKGGLEPFRQELMAGMLAHGYTREFAEALFRQIQGFGEYGFPESHAASFALLAYASAWLKCHYPAAYLVALLNSQPMGFYRPAQLVQDARRHHVPVLPVDVCHSSQEATLVLADAAPPAVRLGFNQIQGFNREAAARLEQARAAAPWHDAQDLWRRAGLDDADRRRLAAAGALRSLSGHRRQAAWDAATPQGHDLLEHVVREPAPRLAEPGPAQEVVSDYRSLGLSLHTHPLALLRPGLKRQGTHTAAQLDAMADGRWVRACGLVVGRQRPGTAKGTVFVTLEDETGAVNVIVWPALVTRQRRELLASRLLAVSGRWQVSQGVRHLVANRLWDWTHLLGPLTTRSRDFH